MIPSRGWESIVNRSKLLLAGIAGLVVISIAAVQGRADARVDRLALRVDSLAATLTDVVAAVTSPSVAGADGARVVADTLEVAAIGPIRGRADAPVTLVEFLDYECPFCRQFHSETLPLLLEEYVESGRLRVVLRDLPLSIHEHAISAARAARCAAVQDERLYWRFSDALLAVGNPLDEERISAAARKVGLNVAELEKCAASGDYDDAIEADARAAAEAGLTGTPSFIIGVTTRDGSVRGRAIRGAYPTDVFRDAIEDILQVGADG